MQYCQRWHTWSSNTQEYRSYNTETSEHTPEIAPELRRVTAQPQSRLHVSVLIQMILAVNGFIKVT